MKIKALFVDIGGVLVAVSPQAREKYELLGITKEVSSKIFRYLQTTDRTEAEINNYLAENGLTRELWEKFVQEASYSSEKRNDDLYDILKKAREGGIIIVFTTNNSSALGALMEKYQIADLPDLVINSSEAGVVKPDDAFWRYAIEETKKLIPDITPEDILVIDDSEQNCSSAIKNGMKTLLYKVGDSDEELRLFF
jgi:HAD superfamily hydrolase (TIGR01509 family)